MKKSKSESVRDSGARLQRAARERADDQARRIPWRRLYDVRNQYVDWQEFYLWARSILEVEKEIPHWLTEILNVRCPGFLQTEKELTPNATKDRPLPLRLEDWIDEHVFEFAKKEGWFNAITYYAVRDPHLVAGERKARASVKLVDPVRLSEAVARYIDYEGLAYWVRPALVREGAGRLPHQGNADMGQRGSGRLAVTGSVNWETGMSHHKD